MINKTKGERFPMKPFIHHVYTIVDRKPDEKIETIKGKAKFQEWAIQYFMGNKNPICFQLEGWDQDYFLEVIPFPKTRGKNIGEPRVVFVNMKDDTDNGLAELL